MSTPLADFIEDWLFREDLRQSQLARRARLAGETLSRIMNGKQKAGPKVLRQLERAMRLERGKLLELVSQTALLLEEGSNGHVA